MCVSFTQIEGQAKYIPVAFPTPVGMIREIPDKMNTQAADLPLFKWNRKIRLRNRKLVKFLSGVHNFQNKSIGTGEAGHFHFPPAILKSVSTNIYKHLFNG